MTELAEQLAKSLKENKVEDPSTLVNNSYILRDAIGQVLAFLESMHVLKVLVNYWNLIFALLGKEIIITRDPENQLRMTVTNSSGTHLFGEIYFLAYNKLVRDMFGEAFVFSNDSAQSKDSSLTGKILLLEIEIRVSEEMIDEYATQAEATFTHKSTS